MAIVAKASRLPACVVVVASCARSPVPRAAQEPPPRAVVAPIALPAMNIQSTPDPRPWEHWLPASKDGKVGYIDHASRA